MWMYKNVTIMKWMKCVKKWTFNAKMMGCRKQKNGRKWSLNFFTFEIIPQQICLLAWVRTMFLKIATNRKRNKSTKNCREWVNVETWRRPSWERMYCEAKGTPRGVRNIG
jgi:hypothetical protein